MGKLRRNIVPALGKALCRWSMVLTTFCGWAASAPIAAAGPFCGQQVVLLRSDVPFSVDSVVATDPQHVSRALAAALAVTLGPFGAHRLYLGTTPKVPLLYGLTFGGFGVLVLIDLGHILFTRDLSAYQDNRQVLMWAGPREGEKFTPP